MQHRGLRYMPALDGLRACGVIAVMLYHGYVGFPGGQSVSWARGGYLGVDAFFVLSGFLITSLLLREWREHGRIDLKAFWVRRARRLLPALAVVLLAVTAYAMWAATPLELHQLRRDGLSSMFYVANWSQIFSHTSYFEQFASAPSALKHTWSLAIEEQFYVLWPLIVFAVLRARRGSGRALLAITAAGATASACLMAVLYHPGHDPSRVYYGTDTRAQSLLVGAVLAMLLADRRQAPTRLRRATLNTAAMVAGVALLAMWSTTSDTAAWQYRGGFLVAAGLVAIVITSVTQDDEPGAVGRLLSSEPLRRIGLISYGLYLWHWPVYVYLSPERTGLGHVPLLVGRFLVTFAIAGASFVIVERPVRRRGGVLRGWPVRIAAPLGASALAFGIVLATAGPLPAEFQSISQADASPAPPSAPPSKPSTKATHRLRVMLVGDSVAASMGPGLAQAAKRRGYVFWDRAVPGCGLATDVGERWFDEWRGLDKRCTDGWRSRWPKEVAAFKPDVVVALFGGQDAFDRRIDGQVTKFDSPGGFALAEQDLREAAKILESKGAHLVLLTTPYYKLGWPQKIDVDRSPLSEAWINRYNDIQRDVVRKSAGKVSLLDLNHFLDPNGTWTDTVNGVPVRTFDKCHLSLQGSVLTGSWVASQLPKLVTTKPKPTPKPAAAPIR